MTVGRVPGPVGASSSAALSLRKDPVVAVPCLDPSGTIMSSPTRTAPADRRLP